MIKMVMLFFVRVFLYQPDVWAENVSIVSSIDKTRGTTDDYFQLTVEISGISGSAELDLNTIKDFEIISQNQSTQVKIINGAVQRSKNIILTLSPLKEGKSKVPSLKMRYQGRIYNTQPILVNVDKAIIRKQPGTQKDIYLTAKASNPSPYIGQQIVYTVSLFSVIRFSDAELKEPSYNGFKKQDIKKNKNFTKVINGRRYNVIEVNRILIPQKSGKIALDSAEITTYIMEKQKGQRKRGRSGFGGFFNDPFFNDSFFAQRKKIRLRAEKLNLNVRELPLSGKPKGFLNLVGKVSLRAKFDRNVIRVGDSLTITITATANTDLEGILLPSLPSSINYKIYEDKPSYDMTVNNNQIYSQKIFKLAIVPTKQGMINIPPFGIDYFDTDSRSYRRAKTQQVTLQVNPGDKEDLAVVEGGRSTGLKRKIKLIQDDILPIYERSDALSDQKLTISVALLQASLPLSLFLLYLGLFFYQRRMRFLHDNEKGIISNKAYKKWFKALNDLKNLKGSDSKDSIKSKKSKKSKKGEKGEDKEKDVLARIADIFRSFLGERLGEHVSAQTSSEIKVVLEQKGVSPEVVRGTIDILQKAEMALYGASNSIEDVDQIIDRSLQLLTDLNRVKSLKMEK